MTEKTILGIDPGTNVMGYGLLHVTYFYEFFFVCLQR